MTEVPGEGVDDGDVEEEALTEPVFLIEQGGKFYLTVAVWEYDDSDRSNLTPDQIAGVAMVRDLHADGCKAGHHKAIRVEADTGVFAQHTNPANPGHP